jgi:hypothetical protein
MQLPGLQTQVKRASGYITFLSWLSPVLTTEKQAALQNTGNVQKGKQ